MSLVNQYSDVICTYYAALKPRARVNRIKKLDESALNILLNILAEKNVSREDLKTVRDGLKRVEKLSFIKKIKTKSAVQGKNNLLKALHFFSHTPQLVKEITKKVIKIYMEIVITERVAQLDQTKLLLGRLKNENLEVDLFLFEHIDTTFTQDLFRIHLNPKILPLLVNVKSAVIIPQHLAALKNRDKIEKLTLKYGEVDKATLKLLESLTNLQFLTLERCQFDSDVWERVKMLKPTPEIIRPYIYQKPHQTV